MDRRTWARGAVALALLGGLVAVMIASPVGAAITKKKVKTTATNVVNQLAPGIASSTVNQLAPGIATSAVNQLAPGIATQVAGPLAGRFAFARETDALVGTPGTVVSTTITAPTNGHLAINAGTDSFGGAAGEDLDCVLDVDGTNLISSQRSVEFSTEDDEDNCITEGAVAVTAGSHTVRFEASFTDTDITLDEAVLWVMFVPFNASGNLPAGPSLG